MTNPLYSFDQLPATSGAAIRQFSDRFLATLGAAKPSMIDALMALETSPSPLLTFPVSQLRSQYTRTQGEDQAKTLRETSFDVKSEEFDDGFEVELKKLLQGTYSARRWKEAPARLVLAEEQFRASQFAAFIEAGTGTTKGTSITNGGAFFATTHKANLFDDSAGTFSNYQSSTKDVVSVTNIEAEVTLMQAAVKDENGNTLGVMPDTILCPIAKFEPLKNLLKKEMIVSGAAFESNPYLNSFNVIPIKEFTDANDWYLVDSKLLNDFPPIVMLRETVAPALALRVFDEASDFFKKTGKLKFNSHIWYGTAYGLPHAIRKIAGA